MEDEKITSRMAKVYTAAAKYLRASNEREMFTNNVEAQTMGMATTMATDGIRGRIGGVRVARQPGPAGKEHRDSGGYQGGSYAGTPSMARLSTCSASPDNI